MLGLDGSGSVAHDDRKGILDKSQLAAHPRPGFASSFGTLLLTRAYADWSSDVKAAYHGADIPLAVDAVEDMFRLPDLTHVVIVRGDSDYIALAQRCKRLGRDDAEWLHNSVVKAQNEADGPVIQREAVGL
jgi:hypothetical protein